MFLLCVSVCPAVPLLPCPPTPAEAITESKSVKRGQVRPLPWAAYSLERQNPAETFRVPLQKGKRALPAVFTWLFCAVEVQVFNLRT